MGVTSTQYQCIHIYYKYLDTQTVDLDLITTEEVFLNKLALAELRCTLRLWYHDQGNSSIMSRQSPCVYSIKMHTLNIMMAKLE